MKRQLMKKKNKDAYYVICAGRGEASVGRDWPSAVSGKGRSAGSGCGISSLVWMRSKELLDWSSGDCP